MVGTVRPQDASRIASLRAAIDTAHLSDRVTLILDMDRTALNTLLGQSMIGIHTMRDEHFGIGVVELMAVSTSHHTCPVSAGPVSAHCALEPSCDHAML